MQISFLKEFVLGPYVNENMSPKRESNERTKQNGILKGDQKL
jgi:hypothetical protein